MPANPQTVERLRAIVSRVEHLTEEKSALQADIGEVYKEAKGEGFDPKILRKVVSLRRKSAAAREEEQSIISLYLSSIEGVPANVAVHNPQA